MSAPDLPPVFSRYDTYGKHGKRTSSTRLVRLKDLFRIKYTATELGSVGIMSVHRKNDAISAEKAEEAWQEIVDSRSDVMKVC